MGRTRLYSRLSLSRLEDGELAIKVNLGCNYYYYYSRLSIVDMRHYDGNQGKAGMQLLLLLF